MKATEAPALIRQERRLRLGLSQACAALSAAMLRGGFSGGLGGEDGGWLWVVVDVLVARFGPTGNRKTSIGTESVSMGISGKPVLQHVSGPGHWAE